MNNKTFNPVGKDWILKILDESKIYLNQTYGFH